MTASSAVRQVAPSFTAGFRSNDIAEPVSTGLSQRLKPKNGKDVKTPCSELINIKPRPKGRG